MPEAFRAPFSDYMSADNSVTMLRAEADQLPGDLSGVEALFIDREGTGQSLDTTLDAVATTRRRELYSIIRSDGLGDAELSLCASAKPDAIVLPQIRNANELDTVREKFASVPAVALIAQIETVDAVTVLEQIMAVQGITGFLIGPNDLAEDMGYPGKPTHPHVEETVNLVAVKLAAANRPFGLPAMTSSARTTWYQKGAKLLFITLPAYLELESTSNVSPT